MPTSFSHCLERLIAIDGVNTPSHAPPAQWTVWRGSTAFSDLTPTLSQPPQRHELALLLALQWQHHSSENLHLHPHFIAASQHFWWALAVTLLHDWSPFLSSRHPLTFVAEQLLDWGRGYEPLATPESTREWQTLDALCRDIAAQAVSKSAAMMQAIKQLHEHLQQLQQRQRQNDKRLLLNEEKERRSHNCQAAVSRVLRRAIYGQPVPALITDFLDSTWRRYLYQRYLQHGMEGDEWQHAVRDLELLVWLGSDASADEVKAAAASHYPALRERLRAAIATLRHDAPLRMDFFSELDYLIEARARNAPDAGLPLGELPFDDEDDDNAYSPRHELTSLPIRIGQIVMLNVNGEQRRARLLEIDHVNDALLFADALGGKIANLTRQQFSQRHERGDAALIAEPNLVQSAADKLTPLLEQALVAAESGQREQLATRRREREAEMAAQFDERRKHEAHARAERVARAKQEAEDAQKRESATQQIDQLRSGAMLHLSLNSSAPRTCFLAFINAQSDHFVIVDRQGQRIADLLRQQMIDLYLTRQLDILESGTALNTRGLSDLVRERREFLNDGKES